jgi:spore coat protein U-like protein
MSKFFVQLILATLVGTVSCFAVTKTATDSLTIQMHVVSSCTIYASTLNFGNYSGNTVNNTTSLHVTCTNTTPYKIGLDAGMASGATVATRKMVLGPNILNYTLYQDAARTIVWGNTPGTNTVNGTGTGLSQVWIVYGRIPSNQTVPVGNYSDTITSTIYF